MGSLIINLRPWERFLVGDIVLQNGSRRTQLRLQDESAGVLRLSDALHPDQVKTPLTRAYFVAQLLLLGRDRRTASPQMLERLLNEVRYAVEDSSPIAEALRHARNGRYHKVLRALKPLLPEEALLLELREVQGSVRNLSAVTAEDLVPGLLSEHTLCGGL